MKIKIHIKSNYHCSSLVNCWAVKYDRGAELQICYAFELNPQGLNKKRENKCKYVIDINL